MERCKCNFYFTHTNNNHYYIPLKLLSSLTTFCSNNASIVYIITPYHNLFLDQNHFQHQSLYVPEFHSLWNVEVLVCQAFDTWIPQLLNLKTRTRLTSIKIMILGKTKSTPNESNFWCTEHNTTLWTSFF